MRGKDVIKYARASSLLVGNPNCCDSHHRAILESRRSEHRRVNRCVCPDDYPVYRGLCTNRVESIMVVHKLASSCVLAMRTSVWWIRLSLSE